jgi:SAM-dependent methyltransferase
MVDQQGELAGVIVDRSGWPDYYEAHRTTTSDVYPSEWFFLKDLLRESVSILDVGCAAGGLASICREHLRTFEYTGVDISEEMVRRGKQRHPEHQFHVIGDADLTVLGGREYDLVVCLGVLHLTRTWRELVAASWVHTKGALLLDLRESSTATLEDPTVSYYRVDELPPTGAPTAATLPYNVINSSDARGTLLTLCAGAVGLTHYGYLSQPSGGAVTPVKDILMNTYRIDRKR